MAKGTHMSIDDRDTILIEIKNNTLLKDIAIKINKDPTSISKEVKKHRYMKEMKRGDYYHSYCSICSIVQNCHKKKLCSSICKDECKHCLAKDPTTFCSNFIIKECKRINRFNYVCNGCSRIGNCRLNHYFYDPKLAQQEYGDILVSSRSGIDCTEEAFKKLDEIISTGVKNGKSIYAILLNHPEINVSERTIYRYIEARYLQVKNHDLRNKVKMKPRKAYKYKDKIKKRNSRDKR